MSHRSDRRSSAAGPFVRSLTGLEAAAWLLVVVALVADVVLTTRGLALGAVEVNPLGRAAIEAVGPIRAMVALKLVGLAAGLAAWRVLPRSYRVLAPACLAAPWAVAALSNARIVAVLG